jgi:hypothetical protein
MILARCCWQQQFSAQMPCLCLSLITAWGPRCKRHRGCGRVCVGRRDTILYVEPSNTSFSFFFLSFSLYLSLTLKSRPFLFCVLLFLRARVACGFSFPSSTNAYLS